MGTLLPLFSVFLLSLSAMASETRSRVVYADYLSHVVPTSDGVGLQVVELLRQGRPMAGAPPILLVHGFGGTLNNWSNVADAYRRAGLRVFLANWRGHGQGPNRSVPLEGPMREDDPRFSFHRLPAIDVPTLVDFVHARAGKRKLVYQSHSMGGMMAHLAFAGVGTGSDGKVSVSRERALSFERKIAAFVPVSGPLSLSSRSTPLSRMANRLLTITGIHGDRSSRAFDWFADSQLYASYTLARSTGSLEGLMNLQHVSYAEYRLFSLYGGSDVPSVIHREMNAMTENGYRSPEGEVDYGAISQRARSGNGHLTRIPTLLISGTDDSLALLEEQDRLASEQGLRQLRLQDVGHLDILASERHASEVVRETLAFLDGVWPGLIKREAAITGF